MVVGARNRGNRYASYALPNPDRLRIVCVADPSEPRRRMAAEAFGLPSSQCYESAEDVAERPQLADAVINGTVDRQHVPTSMPLLAAGCDILLTKPFATGEEEMWRLIEAGRRHGRKIMACHVLRYAPLLPRGPQAGRTRRDRAYHQRADRRARELPPHGRRLRQARDTWWSRSGAWKGPTTTPSSTSRQQGC